MNLPERRKDEDIKATVEENVQNIDNELKSIEVKIKNIEDDELNANNELDSLRKEALQIQDKIDAVGGSELHGIKVQIEDLRRLMEEKNNSLTKVKTRKLQAEKTIKKATRDLEKLKQDLENLTNTINQLNEQQKAGLQEGVQLYTRQNELTEELKPLPNQIQQLEQEIDQTKTQLVELQKNEVIVTEDLKKTLEEIHTVEENIDAIDEEIEKLKNTPVGFVSILLCFLLLLSYLFLSLYSFLYVFSSIERTLMEFPEMNDDQEDKRFMNKFNLAQAEVMIKHISEALEKTQVDLTSIAKYREKEQEFNQRMKELDTVTRQRDEERERGEQLKKKRYDEFMNGFKIIQRRLKEMYQVC